MILYGSSQVAEGLGWGISKLYNHLQLFIDDGSISYMKIGRPTRLKMVGVPLLMIGTLERINKAKNEELGKTTSTKHGHKEE